MSKTVGYVRVSTQNQNEDRQIIAMHEMGISQNNIYIDKASGKDFERPMYKKMLRRIKKDDVIFIKSIDRLGRNYEDVIEQWKYITKTKRADIVVLDMPILDTRRGKDLMGTFLTDIVLALLSYVSESERAMIRQRVVEGVAAAKAKGVHFGKCPKEVPEGFDEAYILWKNGEATVSEAATKCNMPRSSFYDKARQRSKREKDAECVECANEV